MKIFNKKTTQKTPSCLLLPTKRAFTLVEMLIIAPIVILVIGIFVSAIVGMTGEVLSVRAASDLSLKVQNALNSIDNDVKLSAGYLATNNITLKQGQGYPDQVDNNTSITNFHNADSATGNILILNTYATTTNPLTSSRNYVYLKNQLKTCDSSLISQNSRVMMNIVYFVKDQTLWRRVLAPSTSYNYATAGCSEPWQKPTCAPDYTAWFCKANDTKLIDGIITADGFKIDYYSIIDNNIAIASSDANSDATRQSAMQNASSIKITITATKTIAGRDITQTGKIKSTNLDSQNSNSDPTTIVRDGALTALIPGTINTGTYPSKIVSSADGKSVYAISSNNPTYIISMYSRNTSTGALTALGTPIATGTNPSDITISTDGKSVYAINNTSNTISMYSRDTSSGLLTALGAPIATGTTPSSITISSDGTSVYVTNSVGTTISMYSRNTSTGALTALGTPTIATQSSPSGINISTDGTSVFATNYSSNTISMYSRNTSTGLLSALGTPIATGTAPSGITISDDGTSVYATNTNSANISMYSR